MTKRNNGGMNRRRFLKNSAIGVGAVGIAIGTGGKVSGEENPKTPSSSPLKIKEYLGRTGFKVSDIGSGFVDNPAVLEQLLDAGVNYIDTAESYGNESMLGSVIKKRDRKSVFISTKLEVKKDLSKEGFLSRAYKCLERLQTDYVDCIMMHAPEKVETLKTEGFHAAVQQLKKEGKLHFVGVTHHGSNWYLDSTQSMETVLTTAAADGRFDVMLLAYNFIQDDNGARVLEICREKNIGTTLMKVNPIGNIPLINERMEQLKKEGKEVPDIFPGMIARMEAKRKRAEAFIKKYRLDDYNRMRDAAIRFCLSNPNVHTICCAFKNFDHLQDFISLSGTRLQDMEEKQLAAYKEGCGVFYCRHACGLCEPACPNQVPINTIMRYNHYFDAQGKEKYAMKNYAKLPGAKADLCAHCQGFCESACPYGVPIHGLLTMAHRTLSLNIA
jgi:predicted aldo/keto reductase-like oxidoreductase